MGIFACDTKGFGQVFADRPIHRMVEELIANALDEKVTRVDIHMDQVTGTSYELSVVDDAPDGFQNLAESYTLFAASKKKGDTAKRGRFNFGEKWVIARCKRVTITSTTGTVFFDVVHDRRGSGREKRATGTSVLCEFTATKAEYEAALPHIRSILIPEGVEVWFNHRCIESRRPVAINRVTLPTVVAGEDGSMVRTERLAEVEAYAVLPGEKASIYELGIPVVETGDVYHYNVKQRVPLSLQRNNVSPAYLKRLRAAILDVTADLLTGPESTNKGVTDGLALADPKTIQQVMDTRFGTNRYVPDFNRESSGELFAEGAAPVPPQTFDAATWEAIKAAGAIKSANQLRPKLAVAGKSFPECSITHAMRRFREFTEMVCRLTLGTKIVHWRWSDTPEASSLAQCGPCDGGVQITFNVANLGVAWFDRAPATCEKHIDIIVHELGHHAGAMDCTREHADAMTAIAAKLAVKMLTDPVAFAPYIG